MQRADNVDLGSLYFLFKTSTGSHKSSEVVNNVCPRNDVFHGGFITNISLNKRYIFSLLEEFLRFLVHMMLFIVVKQYDLITHIGISLSDMRHDKTRTASYYNFLFYHSYSLLLLTFQEVYIVGSTLHLWIGRSKRNMGY